MKKVGSWLWGLVLVALGVILGVNALGIAKIDVFFPGWWTLFIIVPCLIGLITDEHKAGPLVGLVIGVCFLLSSLGVLSFSVLWKLMLPAILIVVGLAVIARSSTNGEVADKIHKARKRQAQEKRSEHVVEAEVIEEDDDDDDNEEDEEQEKWTNTEEYWSTFGDQDINFAGKKFNGCRIDAVFGGADLDLRGADIKDEAIVKASSVFGGVIIYAPEDVKVEIASTSIFGGVTDKRKDAGRKARANDDKKVEHKADNAGKTLYIEATCVFGGVEIR